MSASTLPDVGSAGNGRHAEDVPESKPVRRRYTREDKLRILRLVDACKERGQVASILRREGIYSSTLNDFRKQQQEGRLEVGASRSKSHKPHDPNEIARLRRENARLQRKLEQAELIIDVQKKVSQLLGITLQTIPSDAD
jgi:transposase-like protein